MTALFRQMIADSFREGMIELLCSANSHDLATAFPWSFSDEGGDYWCERFLGTEEMSEGDWYKIRFYAREAGLLS